MGKPLSHKQKAFDLLAKGLSGGNWLPILDEFWNFCLTSQALDSKPIEEILALTS